MKAFLRTWLILSHRYLGIVLSLLFVVWFASGITMMYAGGMPRLSPESRLQKLPTLDPARVRLTPAEAARQGGVGRNPGRVVLLNVMERPAYRFGGGQSVTVFADNGEMLEELDEARARTIASRFVALPPDTLHDAGMLTRPDQWTIGAGRGMPLHKFHVDDPARTDLYVSAELGEVTLETTRHTRPARAQRSGVHADPGRALLHRAIYRG